MSFADSVHDTTVLDSRDRDVEDLLNRTDLPQMPALHADAFTSVLPIAQAMRAKRADAAAMQQRAIRVGALTGSDGFYRFPAGGSTIEGPTVRLAKALAIEWGNVAFGVVIDRVEGNRVYLTGVCVDLNNVVVVRRSSTFVLSPAPGKFANKPDQVARWEAMQIQSAGAKALRGAILDALPSWFVQPAYQAALDADRKQVLKAGQSIESARDEAVRAFGALKVTREQLESLVGSPIVQWAPADIATLRDTIRAINKGETTVEEVFGTAPAPATTTTEAPSKLPGKTKKPDAAPPPAAKTEPAPAPPKTEPPPADPAPTTGAPAADPPKAETLSLQTPPADDADSPV